jgi:hypothetical protein
MRKPKVRNKKYVPQIMPSLPICFALPKDAKTELALMPHACIAAVVDGSACEANLYTLANCLNMGGVIADRNHPESLPEAIAGQEAIIRVIERFGKTGKIGFSGEDYQAIKAGVTLCDALQAAVTRRELRDVIQILQRLA